MPHSTSPPACQARAAADHLLVSDHVLRRYLNAANDFPEPQGRVLLNFPLLVSLAQEILLDLDLIVYHMS